MRQIATITPWASSPRSASEPWPDFARTMEPVWKRKSALEVGEDQPGEDEDRLGHRSDSALMAGSCSRHRLALDQRPHDARELAELAEMGAVGRDRDRRPADTETLGDLRPAAALDEHQPPDLALAIGQVVEELAEERGRPVEEVVDPGDRRGRRRSAPGGRPPSPVARGRR